uniref:Trafficking protein particle complex subunit 2-like protein n=1 Tax=Caenorhabditis japonica TaxID=281687 RepID=A0A8R1DUV2_CAEJA
MLGVAGFFIYGRENVRLFASVNPRYAQQLFEIEMFTFCSLDIVDERATKATEMYLGQLYNDQQFRSYGYITNTGVRMLVVFDSATSISVKDQEIRLIFKRFHGHFCLSISNPFYEIGTPIESKWLDEGVRDLYAGSE